jgi:hypothetical protein
MNPRPAWTWPHANNSSRQWTNCAGPTGKLASVLVTHHIEEIPASTTHALLLRDGLRAPGDRLRQHHPLLRSPDHHHRQ